MKKIVDIFAIALAVLFVLALVFLFIGQPDLWDKLHAMAMSGTQGR